MVLDLSSVLITVIGTAVCHRVDMKQDDPKVTLNIKYIAMFLKSFSVLYSECKLYRSCACRSGI